VPEYICVDASLAIKWVLPEADSDQAESLLRKWKSQGMALLAPHLFIYEICSILAKRMHRKELSLPESLKAIQALDKLEIQMESPAGLQEEALRLARELNQPAAYDAAYLALAIIKRCEFFTADKKLINLLDNRYSWVKQIPIINQIPMTKHQ
jgi:predicted nucleic acid-binding protein